MIELSRDKRRNLERENARWPVALVEIPKSDWPISAQPSSRIHVWRSRDYLVQAFSTGPNLIRLSVNRTTMTGPRWDENISWDDLQRLKREAGFGNFDAVEIYPADADIVNVANMRHLWVFTDGYRLPFTWRTKP